MVCYSESQIPAPFFVFFFLYGSCFSFHLICCHLAVKLECDISVFCPYWKIEVVFIPGLVCQICVLVSICPCSIQAKRSLNMIYRVETLSHTLFYTHSFIFLFFQSCHCQSNNPPPKKQKKIK